MKDFQPSILLARMGKDEKYLPVFLLKSFPDNQFIGFRTEFPVNAVARVTGVLFPQIVFLRESAAVFRFETRFRVQNVVPVRNIFRRNRRRQNGAVCHGGHLLPKSEQSQRIPAFPAKNPKADLTAKIRRKRDRKRVGIHIVTVYNAGLAFLGKTVFDLKPKADAADRQPKAAFETKLKLAGTAFCDVWGNMQRQGERKNRRNR